MMEGVISELRFAETHRYRPFALVSPETLQVESAQPETSLRADGLIITSQRPAAPFAAVELRVETAGDASVVTGLGSLDGDDHVLTAYDLVQQRASIELRTGGRTRVVAVRNIALQPPFGFAFALCENSVTALADTGDGWQPLVTAHKNIAAFVDFRSAAVLGRFAFAYGSRPRPAVKTRSTPSHPMRRILGRGKRPPASAGDGAPVLGSVRAGPFGMAGVRDPHVVQRPDGTPYVRGRKLYLTMTCAGLGFFQQAHWGVFTLDLDDLTRLEQVAQLYFTRDGLVLGDHAGQHIVDGERLIVAVSSWGDFTPGDIHVRHTVTSRDVLSGVHVLPTEPLSLPTKLGAWDPALTRIGGRWYVGFVESPSQGDRFDFHPALAVGAPGHDYAGPLQLVGADEALHQCEGPILTRLDGEWRLVASDRDHRDYPIYDLDMCRVGSLDAPYLSNIPHPQLVTVPGPSGPRHLMVTFNGSQYAEGVLGYGGHGDLVILEAAAPSD